MYTGKFRCLKHSIISIYQILAKNILSYYRCTADCGWISGHSYVSYGPLLDGATVVLYEGVIYFNLGLYYT